MGSLSASNVKVVCRKVCFKRLIKFQVKKKGLIGVQDSYQDQAVLFNVHMYDEFHVNSRGTDSNKSNLIDYRYAIFRNYTRQLYKHIHVVHHICSTCLLLLLISKILKGLDYDNTTLVDCLFSRDDFDCSVIHTWGNDKSKAVIGGVTIPQTWREHLPENGS